MAKLIDYCENPNIDNVEGYDKVLLEMTVNFDLYNTLQDMARDTCNLLEDDRLFSDAEWNLFHEWFDKKGFTDDDWKYVFACGYGEDQFGGDDYDEL